MKLCCCQRVPANRTWKVKNEPGCYQGGLNPAAARVDGMVSWQARGQAARHGAAYVRVLGHALEPVRKKVRRVVWRCWEPLTAGPGRPEVV